MFYLTLYRVSTLLETIFQEDIISDALLAVTTARWNKIRLKMNRTTLKFR